MIDNLNWLGKWRSDDEIELKQGNIVKLISKGIDTLVTSKMYCGEVG